MIRREIALGGSLEAAEKHFHYKYGLWGLRALAAPPGMLVGFVLASAYPPLGIVAALLVYGGLYGGLKKITYTRIK